MLDLYLFRHGKSAMQTKHWLIGGRSNETPLIRDGVYQSYMLGYRLKRAKIVFDEIYSSSATRTRETSRITCGVIEFPLEKIVVCEDLLEQNQGNWEGKPRQEIYTPEMLEKINSDNWHFTPPNGESQRAVEERMLNWINQNLVARYTNNICVGIFGHGTAIKCLLRGIMGFSPKMTYKIAIENTSITRLHYNEKGWHPICINDYAHIL